MDRAAWHVPKDLVVPDNVRPLPLPPYSPGLNPVERLWAWVRQHKLINRVLPAEEALDARRGEMMLEMPPELVRTVCRCSWLEHAA